jgi:hypothetical protein
VGIVVGTVVGVLGVVVDGGIVVGIGVDMEIEGYNGKTA